MRRPQQRPQHPVNAEPEWLRRTYTRTIPRDLRTIAQLRLSFEDVRSQWRGLCDAYASESADPLCHTAPSKSAAEALPAGTRRHMDHVVSQLKAVKQELLAQLSKLSSAITPPKSASTSHAVAAWVADLVECGPQSGSCSPHASKDSAAASLYLEAVWLARRVWVWSICFACATMDLELLSGSVSVAAELFFGNCAVSPTVAMQDDAGERCSVGFLTRSSYSFNGAITEVQLYAAAASAASATGHNTAQPDTAARLRGVVQPSLQQTQSLSLPDVSEEERELQAFFGCCSSSGSTHRDPNDATARSESPTSLRDAFWVQAVALSYSIMVRDDTSAARLLSQFQELHRRLSELHDAASATPKDAAVGAAAAAAAPSGQAHALCTATGFVQLLAERLIDEDYGAVARLLQHPSNASGDFTSSADATAEAPRAQLCAVCSGGGVLMRFLVRLLAEHVVRRRWAEEGMGQAFRPVEPAASTANSDVSNAAAHRNRLVCVLVGGADAPRAQTKRPRAADGCAVKLCDAFQRDALCSMGGDWPLPPSILRSSVA